jgi:hypothetical protein
MSSKGPYLATMMSSEVADLIVHKLTPTTLPANVVQRIAENAAAVVQQEVEAAYEGQDAQGAA